MMNDQTSPTAGGQRPEPPRRDPFAAPPDARGLPPIPEPVADRGHGAPEAGGAGRGPVPANGAAGAAGGAGAAPAGQVPVWGAPAQGFPPPVVPAGQRPSTRDRLRLVRPDIEVGAVLAGLGAVLGLLGGMAWYRFAPTVWMSIPADAVSQVKDGVDQYALLVSPEAKGIVSVDGYFFVMTAVAGLLLGTAGFFLARRGLRPVRGRKADDQDGAGVGAWVGVLVGGLLATTITAALGRWISMPDPIVLLRKIAAGQKFHAVVALHAQGLYLAAPIIGLVWFTALTAAFTKPVPPPTRWVPYGDRPAPGYFTTDNPYGLPASSPGTNGRPAPGDHAGE
jgi:hypothetical protein